MHFTYLMSIIMQSSDLKDAKARARIGAALRGPFHKALGIRLPEQLRRSPKVHKAAQALISEPVSLDWAVQVRRKGAFLH